MIPSHAAAPSRQNERMGSTSHCFRLLILGGNKVSFLIATDIY
jgi:hypothetical protein